MAWYDKNSIWVIGSKEMILITSVYTIVKLMLGIPLNITRMSFRHTPRECNSINLNVNSYLQIYIEPDST